MIVCIPGPPGSLPHTVDYGPLRFMTLKRFFFALLFSSVVPFFSANLLRRVVQGAILHWYGFLVNHLLCEG